MEPSGVLKTLEAGGGGVVFSAGVGEVAVGAASCGALDAEAVVCEAATVSSADLVAVPPPQAVRLRASAEINAVTTCDFPMPRSLATPADTFHVTQEAPKPT